MANTRAKPKIDAEANADFAVGHTMPPDVVGDWLFGLAKGQTLMFAQITITEDTL